MNAISSGCNSTSTFFYQTFSLTNLKKDKIAILLVMDLKTLFKKSVVLFTVKVKGMKVLYIKANV